MNEFVRTEKLVSRCKYRDTASDFFSMFGDAWASARGQVLKLETRQHYVEPGNESLDLALAGNFSQALEEIPNLRAVDDELYATVNRKKLDFIRCRPIKIPKTIYLNWELEVYKYNAERGEQIYCCHYESMDVIFDRYARHDFMIFDARIAFIHDYDKEGLIQGGWFTTDQKHIRSLIALYSFIKANCQHFSHYLND